jgi:hypothetical protein
MANKFVVPKPAAALGMYSLGVQTGILPAALAANSEMFQFRWSVTDKLAVIERIELSASVTTTFFAAGVPVQVDLIKSTAWTVAGTLGTAPAVAATLKARSSVMQSSALVAGDVRVATTAALGAGTKTLEANSLNFVLAGGPITASLNGTIFPPNTVLYDSRLEAGQHPLVLEANEGFSIRSVAVPGTGTWQAAFKVTWSEVGSYPV